MTPALSAVVIAVRSIPILWISRRSLLSPSSYGFYRFFAVESLLALIVLNAPKWFAHLFAAQQLVSGLLLLASVVTAIDWIPGIRSRDDFRRLELRILLLGDGLFRAPEKGVTGWIVERRVKRKRHDRS